MGSTKSQTHHGWQPVMASFTFLIRNSVDFFLCFELAGISEKSDEFFKCHGADSPEAWYGPPKFVSGAGPQHFVYNVQYLAGESPRFLEVAVRLCKPGSQRYL